MAKNIITEEELKALLKANNKLRAALHDAVGVIRTWHNLDMRQVPQIKQDEMWAIYLRSSPEMKTIREAINSYI